MNNPLSMIDIKDQYVVYARSKATYQAWIKPALLNLLISTREGPITAIVQDGMRT
jgi:hypothetical protein